MMPITAVRSMAWLAMALTLALVIEGLLRPRGLTLDFANFYDAGQKARAGEFAGLYDPFAQIAGQPPFGNMSFFSAPLTSYFYIPLTLLPPEQSSLVFKLAGTLAQVLGLWLLYRRFLPLAGADPAAQAAYLALFAIAALMFQPFWVIYAVGGQTTPFVFLLLVLGYLALQRGYFGWLALAMSLVVVIKPAFATAALLLFLLLPNRFRLVALICGTGFGLASFLWFGADLHSQFLALVASETTNLQVPWQNSNPFSWIEPLFLSPEDYKASGQTPDMVRQVGFTLRMLSVVLLIGVMILHRRQVLKQAASRHMVYVTALMVVVSFSPVVWSHYLTVLFIPLAALIALRRHLGWLSLVLLSIAVLIALEQNLILLRAVIRALGTDSSAVILALGMMKSAPALLILLVTLLDYRGISRALADPAWSRLAP